MASAEKSIHVVDDEAGGRLDRVLAAHVAELSRSRLKTLIENGAVALGAHTIRDITVDTADAADWPRLTDAVNEVAGAARNTSSARQATAPAMRSDLEPNRGLTILTDVLQALLARGAPGQTTRRSGATFAGRRTRKSGRWR